VAGGLALTQHREVEHVPPPVELELAPPEPDPTPQPPQPVAKEETPEPSSAATHAPVPTAPAAARAGALLTAKDDPQAQAQPEGPIDFTNDPTVAGFGGGVVAVGGKADFGVKGARPDGRPSVTASAAPAARGSGEILTPVADLGRKPSLGESDPCRGYFPSAAVDDVASASVLVTVGKTGMVSNVSVLSESPRAQGFGAAARSCMLSKRFTPALDREGRPAATAVRVNVRFSR
jgi:TonB family protein